MQRRNLRQAYHLALKPLREAEPFDSGDKARSDEYKQLLECAERGQPTTYTSREDLDVFWVRRYQELTRNLIAAEKELAAMKIACHDAGVEVEDAEQALVFADHASDGYAWAEEQQVAIPTAPRRDVERWLDGISHPDSPVFEDAGSYAFSAAPSGEAGTADLNGSASVAAGPCERDERYVGVTDSGSAGADGVHSLRRRIDQWRQRRRVSK